MKKKGWKFAVDRGGTFTDLVAVDPNGKFATLKLLSSSPDYKDASIEGIRRMLSLSTASCLPEKMVEAARFGSTVATNALLERKGGRVALLVTKGFADLLEIGYQARPELFSLCIKKPSVLYSNVLEVDERIDQDGSVIRKIDLGGLEVKAGELKKAGLSTVAVVFMHSWRNPAHELECEALLKRHGFKEIFLSHRTMNLIKIISRGQSTVVDAYLSPVINRYMEGIREDAGEISVEFIRSSGEICKADRFTGKNAILSGPAGGVIALAAVAKEMSLEGVIGFDMGGTSTDVSRYDTEFERIYEKVVAGVEMQTEMLNIVTVASGGGSLLWFDGRKMRVGPESAGAHPGPLCYGFGGRLAVTDANLITGRIIPEYFPRTFGNDRKSPLEKQATQERFHLLAREISQSMKRKISPHEAALGFLKIANEKMAMAIKEISVSRGVDVRKYTLVCFGGAGGQHACGVASLLDMKKIIFHPLGGVMSAYGIGLANPAEKSVRTVLKAYNRKTDNHIRVLFGQMQEELVAEMGDEPGKLLIKRELDLRPKGSNTFITVTYSDYDVTVTCFKHKHERLFGFCPEDTQLEVVNLRVEAAASGGFFPPYVEWRKSGTGIPEPVSVQEVFYPGGMKKAPVYLREEMPAGAVVNGPAFLIDPYSTLVIDPGWRAVIDENSIITLDEIQQPDSLVSMPLASADPVLLEVFNNLFTGIAVEMGHILKNSSHSVNIKERLDFSCAVFDVKGELIANAPHIPVHLGSMADTVKGVIKEKTGSMKPGDFYLTNNPYKGGSHLPDLTVVSPVFSQDGAIIFFTAARGHHADIGGITPGSLPPEAKHIDEEGVLIDSFLVARSGVFRKDALKQILSRHKYPARNINERISDLRAQIASCNKGEQELKRVIQRYGWETVEAYMGHIRNNAAYSVKEALFELLKGEDSLDTDFQEHLDDGTLLAVRIFITAGGNPPESVKAVIDFTGTGPAHTDDSLNTPLPVTRSAILYVLRVLAGKEIPLNGGCLEPVEIIIPQGSLLHPVYPMPVGSGNIETSQRLVDLLFGALKITAASQGTMNNLLFEIEGDTPYYETIAGGAGAINGCHGASGVQVNMTNTRMTDPEVLEQRHPGVRLERFSMRKGSGGSGKWRGGDGTIRELKFLKPATVSIISERRVYPPYGMNGGGPGKKGVNILKYANGTTRRLEHRTTIKLNENDSIIIKTPGGGGFGQVGKKKSKAEKQ